MGLFIEVINHVTSPPQFDRLVMSMTLETLEKQPSPLHKLMKIKHTHCVVFAIRCCNLYFPNTHITHFYRSYYAYKYAIQVKKCSLQNGSLQKLKGHQRRTTNPVRGSETLRSSHSYTMLALTV